MSSPMGKHAVDWPASLKSVSGALHGGDFFAGWIRIICGNIKEGPDCISAPKKTTRWKRGAVFGSTIGTGAWWYRCRPAGAWLVTGRPEQAQYRKKIDFPFLLERPVNAYEAKFLYLQIPGSPKGHIWSLGHMWPLPSDYWPRHSEHSLIS